MYDIVYILPWLVPRPKAETNRERIEETGKSLLHKQDWIVFRLPSRTQHNQTKSLIRLDVTVTQRPRYHSPSGLKVLRSNKEVQVPLCPRHRVT